jgi:preprotein translocase subunit SecG
MDILFAFLAVILFLDCIVLILLILLQLPKKEAGAGMAFGGSATDALFGAGSGNALTTITKYSAGIFFGVAFLMAFITTHRGATGGGAFEDELTKPSKAAGQPATLPSPATPSNDYILAPKPVTPAPANSSTPAASSNSAAPTAAPVPTPQPAAPVPTPNPATNK